MQHVNSAAQALDPVLVQLVFTPKPGSIAAVMDAWHSPTSYSSRQAHGASLQSAACVCCRDLLALHKELKTEQGVADNQQISIIEHMLCSGAGICVLC